MIKHTRFARRVALALVLPLLLAAIAGCANSPAASVAPTAAPTAAPQATAIPPTAAPTSPPPTAVISAEQVSIPSEDDVKVAGMFYPNKGALAVLLVHMLGSDQSKWQPFAKELAGQGYAALTIDLRGHGKTEGVPIESDFPKDVLAARQFLAEKGYTRIACVGASIGGDTCMKAALKADFVGLGIVASPLNMLPDDYAKLKVTKLFVVAENDSVVSADSTQTMFKISPEPKQLKMLPGSAHGTEMFDDPGAADQLRSTLLDFLQTLKS